MLSTAVATPHIQFCSGGFFIGIFTRMYGFRAILKADRVSPGRGGSPECGTCRGTKGNCRTPYHKCLGASHPFSMNFRVVGGFQGHLQDGSGLTRSRRLSRVWDLPWYQWRAPQTGAYQAASTPMMTAPTVAHVQLKVSKDTGYVVGRMNAV